MKNIINLTPHALVVIAETGVVITVPASGTVARVATASVSAQMSVPVAALPTGTLISGAGPAGTPVLLAVAHITYGAVEGLPAPASGTFFIVSAVVRAAVGVARPDVLSPGELVRDADGLPVGCKGLVAS